MDAPDDGSTQPSHVWEARLRAAVVAFLALHVVFIMLSGVSALSKARHPGNAFALFALVCAVAAIALRPRAARWTRLHWAFVGALVAFLGVNLLAALLAEETPGVGSTDYERVHLAGVVVALATGLGVTEERRARILLWVLLAGSGLCYLAEAARLPFDSAYLDNRFVGSRNWHTMLAMELLPVFALNLGLAASVSDVRVTALASAGAILTGLLVFMTKTRFALLTMLFVTVPAAFALQKRFGTRRRKLVAALVLFLLVAPAAGSVWYYSASGERRSPASVRTRLAGWRRSAQILARAPWGKALVGHGPGPRSFVAAAARYDAGPAVQHHAHNVPLQTLIDGGVVGAAALVLAWSAALWRAFVAWRSRSGFEAAIPCALVAALLTMATMGQMDYCLHGLPGRLCWFVAGLSFASGAWTGDPALDPSEGVTKGHFEGPS
jgi:hypothetical protein